MVRLRKCACQRVTKTRPATVECLPEQLEFLGYRIGLKLDRQDDGPRLWAIHVPAAGNAKCSEQARRISEPTHR